MVELGRKLRDFTWTNRSMRSIQYPGRLYFLFIKDVLSSTGGLPSQELVWVTFASTVGQAQQAVTDKVAGDRPFSHANKSKSSLCFPVARHAALPRYSYSVSCCDGKTNCGGHIPRNLHNSTTVLDIPVQVAQPHEFLTLSGMTAYLMDTHGHLLQQ